jgi:DNA-binding MarR family transcriptional regulator
MYRVIPILEPERGQGRDADPGQASDSHPDPKARALAVALHDLAWLLPRTVDLDVEADRGPRLRTLPASELEVMRLLVRRPGLTVGDVARELGLQRTNASTAMAALVGRGLLARTQDPADRRVVRLSPTARATEERDVREQAWAAALAHRLERLAPAQRARALACADPLRALVSVLASERS